LVLDPLRVLVTLGSYFLALLPARVGGPIHNLSLAEAHSTFRVLLAIAGIALFSALLAWAILRRQVAVVGLASLIGCSLAPVVFVAALNVPRVAGKYPMADRWLLGALAAASALYAVLGMRIPKPWSSRVFLVASAVVTIAGMAHAWGAHAYYTDELTLLDLEDARFAALPEPFRTLEDRCSLVDRQIVRALVAGDIDRVAALTRSAPAECPGATERQFNLLAALVQSGRVTEAREVLGPLLGARDLDKRQRGPLAHLAGIVLLETGDPAAAEPWLRTALARGIGSCALLDSLGRSLAAQGKTDEAARYAAGARACAKPSAAHP
jgi:hypothetical protein